MSEFNRKGRRYRAPRQEQDQGQDKAAGQTPRVTVIDNYDSFTFNLVQYLLELGAEVTVYRNDAVHVDEVRAEQPTHLLLSPGPGRPSDSGVCQALCRSVCDPSTEPLPTLGVCLGHQTLCEVAGAQVVRAARIMHGKLSPIIHDGAGLHQGLPSPYTATRYHSLIVEERSLPPSLLGDARTPEGELMSVRHRDRPVFGLQYHPESIMSEHGHRLLDTFLKMGR